MRLKRLISVTATYYVSLKKTMGAAGRWSQETGKKDSFHLHIFNPFVLIETRMNCWTKWKSLNSLTLQDLALPPRQSISHKGRWEIRLRLILELLWFLPWQTVLFDYLEDTKEEVSVKLGDIVVVVEGGKHHFWQHTFPWCLPSKRWRIRMDQSDKWDPDRPCTFILLGIKITVYYYIYVHWWTKS